MRNTAKCVRHFLGAGILFSMLIAVLLSAAGCGRQSDTSSPSDPVLSDNVPSVDILNGNEVQASESTALNGSLDSCVTTTSTTKAAQVTIPDSWNDLQPDDDTDVESTTSSTAKPVTSDKPPTQTTATVSSAATITTTTTTAVSGTTKNGGWLPGPWKP